MLSATKLRVSFRCCCCRCDISVGSKTHSNGFLCLCVPTLHMADHRSVRRVFCVLPPTNNTKRLHAVKRVNTMASSRQRRMMQTALQVSTSSIDIPKLCRCISQYTSRETPSWSHFAHTPRCLRTPFAALAQASTGLSRPLRGSFPTTISLWRRPQRWQPARTVSSRSAPPARVSVAVRDEFVH